MFTHSVLMLEYIFSTSNIFFIYFFPFLFLPTISLPHHVAGFLCQSIAQMIIILDIEK